jgi:hypothetical protein
LVEVDSGGVATQYTIGFTWPVMWLPVIVIGVCLYFALRNRVPLWLLVPLVIVLAPVGLLVVIIGLMSLWVVLLPLYAVLTGQAWGNVAIGYNAQPNPVQVYMLVGAAALLVVAVIIYLIRRR